MRHDSRGLRAKSTSPHRADPATPRGPSRGARRKTRAHLGPPGEHDARRPPAPGRRTASCRAPLCRGPAELPGRRRASACALGPSLGGHERPPSQDERLPSEDERPSSEDERLPHPSPPHRPARTIPPRRPRVTVSAPMPRATACSRLSTRLVALLLSSRRSSRARSCPSPPLPPPAQAPAPRPFHIDAKIWNLPLPAPLQYCANARHCETLAP